MATRRQRRHADDLNAVNVFGEPMAPAPAQEEAPTAAPPFLPKVEWTGIGDPVVFEDVGPFEGGPDEPPSSPPPQPKRQPRGRAKRKGA